MRVSSLCTWNNFDPAWGKAAAFDTAGIRTTEAEWCVVPSVCALRKCFCVRDVRKTLQRQIRRKRVPLVELCDQNQGGSPRGFPASEGAGWRFTARHHYEDRRSGNAGF